MSLLLSSKHPNDFYCYIKTMLITLSILFSILNRLSLLGHMSQGMQSMTKESLFGRCIKLMMNGSQVRSEIDKVK